ncbi:MAG: hydrolase [Epsilonproteobacteria bacterium]|nr:hydrolase [Campylobacterota bacterium]
MNKKFNPPFLLKNRHIQTIYSSLFKKVKKHNFYVERFTLSDGDFIECHWYNKKEQGNNKPVVLLFHGLAGSYKSPYIQSTMKTLHNNGFDSVVVHFRGCSGVSNIKPISYHSGKTDDAKEYLDAIQKRFLGIKLYAIGYSLGANMLLKLLGELKEASPITKAVSISCPFVLDICASKMDKGFSKFYRYILLKDLKKELEKKCTLYDMQSLINLKKDDVAKLSSFWEFDEVYTAPVHGFKSAKDYYARCSARGFLKDITTKTLIINSLDDPFMTPDVLPKTEEIAKNTELELLTHGGHVGFIQGSLFKAEYWLDKRVLDYFTYVS